MKVCTVQCAFSCQKTALNVHPKTVSSGHSWQLCVLCEMCARVLSVRARETQLLAALETFNVNPKLALPRPIPALHTAAAVWQPVQYHSAYWGSFSGTWVLLRDFFDHFVPFLIQNQLSTAVPVWQPPQPKPDRLLCCHCQVLLSDLLKSCSSNVYKYKSSSQEKVFGSI